MKQDTQNGMNLVNTSVDQMQVLVIINNVEMVKIVVYEKIS